MCGIGNLEMRRKMHLQLYMFKQKHNVEIVNTRNVYTRAHDAVLYVTHKPNSEKYKKNVFYKGPIAWNSLSVQIRKTQTYTSLKDVLSELLIEAIVPRRDN